MSAFAERTLSNFDRLAFNLNGICCQQLDAVQRGDADQHLVALALGPELEDRVKLVELLKPEAIGVTLSEELQLHPEQSTDAMVLHHPEAKYFSV